MNLFENGTISLYSRKNPDNGQIVFKVMAGKTGELDCIADSGTIQPQSDLLVAEYDYSCEDNQESAILSIYRILDVFRSIQTLGSCRRCRNAVKGDVGSKRVVFCKAIMLGGCGQYGFVENIEEDCPRYEDNGYEGVVFDTERVQVVEYEKNSGIWSPVSETIAEEYACFADLL